jgi:hypothetical protein
MGTAVGNGLRLACGQESWRVVMTIRRLGYHDHRANLRMTSRVQSVKDLFGVGEAR